MSEPEFKDNNNDLEASEPEFIENIPIEEKLILLQEAISSYEEALTSLQAENKDLLIKLQRTQADFGFCQSISTNIR